jgi:NADPH-dependent 2,4-dienoyl-CoA reductase/sulfur reductase-like enzyme
MSDSPRIVVVGGIAGGATAASKARRCCPGAEIEMYDQDEFISYAGCGLPYFIGGRTPNWRGLLARLPSQFESKWNIRVFLRHRVDSIDPDNKTFRVVDLEGVSEMSLPYDKLILATGAVPFVPPLPGRNLEGVFVLRSLSHALEMKSFIVRRAPRRAVIVGGGAVGLEMCEAFSSLGMEVHLVELAEQVLPSLDVNLASTVARHLEERGVRLHLGTKVEGLEGTEGVVKKVITSNGEIEAGVVLLSIGIRPASDLARKAGIELGAKGAIKVDEFMRTSHPDILACGDCAVTRNRVSGRESWIPLGSTARKQGRTAGENAAGGEVSFPGVLGTFILKTFEVTAAKTGLSPTEAREAGLAAEALTIEDSSRPAYYGGGGKITMKITVEEGTGRVLGAQAVGDFSAGVDKRIDILAASVTGNLTVRDLASLDLAYAPPFSHPLDLPVVAGNLAEARIMGKACTCSVEGLEE